MHHNVRSPPNRGGDLSGPPTTYGEAVHKENNMTHLDEMLVRNKELAAERSAAGTLIPWLPDALP